MRLHRSTVRLVLAAVLAAAAAPALAAPLVVPIDQSTRLTVAGSAYSVLVGNPAVADVTVIDSHTLYIQGRGYGATDIVVLDHEGRPLYSGDLVVSAAESGRVSVYRGAARTDLACAPGCQVAVRSTGNGAAGASGSGGGGGGGGSPPAGPAGFGQAMGAAGGAVAGAAAAP